MRSLSAASLLVMGLLVAQQQPQQQPPGEPEATGVFRLPSRMPDEPKPVETAKEDTGPPVLKNEGKPMRLPFACTDEDMQASGMSCTREDPCPVFLEMSAVTGVGERIFAGGNLHDGASTMYSVLVASQDAGLTWTEPVERNRASGYDQMQFFDFETGWVSGQKLGSLPRDPFFLLTTDGGKTWRRREVFSESKVGAVDHFRFESGTAGSVVIDRGSSASDGRYERYETMTGGESWMVREVTSRPLNLKTGPAAQPVWRIRADAKLGAHVIERRAASGWTRIAAFSVRVGECKPADSELPEPPPPPEPAAAKPTTSAPRGPSARPRLKNK